MGTASAKLRVTHVITGIRPHGAELALLRLVRATTAVCQHHLVVVSDSAELRTRFEGEGATVIVIGLGRNSPNPFKLIRLARAIRASRPDVVQTWLPVGDLLGGVAARSTTRRPVVWNLRISEIGHRQWGWPTYLVCRLNALLSHVVPRRIVAIGERTASAHVALGFSRKRLTVIPNGFEIPEGDLDQLSARRQLGLAPEALVVSRLGRFHTDKDFPTLLTAWADVVRQLDSAILAFAGSGLDQSNAELVGCIERAGVATSVVLCGELDDPTHLYAASDLTVSSSTAEGMPNVIGEAMAIGVPAVVTDVGDSAWLVGDTGRVVQPSDPRALADALVEILTLPARELQRLGAAARRRMIDHFSMEAMADRYIALWNEVASVRS